MTITTKRIRIAAGKSNYELIAHWTWKLGKSERKSLFGRSGRWWKGNTKVVLKEIGYLGVYWSHLPQDRGKWRAVVNKKWIFSFIGVDKAPAAQHFGGGGFRGSCKPADTEYCHLLRIVSARIAFFLIESTVKGTCGEIYIGVTAVIISGDSSYADAGFRKMARISW